MRVMACTRFRLQGRQLHNEENESCSLARDTPTGPSLHPYQILSIFFKQYGSYGLHKISTSEE